ncbi:hypothetical protein ACTMU2_08435 [Cupriavidus basilensis]
MPANPAHRRAQPRGGATPKAYLALLGDAPGAGWARCAAHAIARQIWPAASARVARARQARSCASSMRQTSAS